MGKGCAENKGKREQFSRQENGKDLQGRNIRRCLKCVYKRGQAKDFESKTENLQEDEAVVQVDVSENYTCKHREEIQTAHWSEEQVTIFPVAIWTISDDKRQKTCSSHVFATDDRNQHKKAVAVFMDKVLKFLVPEKGLKVKRVYLFSDGPSSQFKNKHMVNFYHKQRKDVKFTWNAFAASHGKDTVDDIGGTVERVAWRAVSSRRSQLLLMLCHLLRLHLSYVKLYKSVS